MSKKKYYYHKNEDGKLECPDCGKQPSSKRSYRDHCNRTGHSLLVNYKNKSTEEIREKKDNDSPIDIQRIEEMDATKEEKLEEMYDAVREFNKSLKNLDDSNRDIEFNVDGDYIVVLVISDLHYGNKNVNMEYVEKLLNFVKEYDRAYCVLNGDIIDNWVKLAPAGGIYDQSIKPEYQEEIITNKLLPIKNKILALITGNHENRSTRQGDKNPAKTMANKLDVAYLGAGGRINLNFGEFVYKMHMRHRYRYESSFNPCHACGRLIEQLDSDADIVGIGHKHDPAVEVRFKAGKQRSLLRFGAAIPSTGYSKSLGYPDTPSVAPLVVLSGKEKMHHPFIDINIAKAYINAL